MYRSTPILVEDHCSQVLLGFGIVQTALKMIDRPDNWSVGRDDNDNDEGVENDDSRGCIGGVHDNQDDDDDGRVS